MQQRRRARGESSRTSTRRSRSPTCRRASRRRSSKLQDAEREFTNQKALFDNGLIGARRVLKSSEIKRDQIAEEELRAAQMRYQIVEDRGIPISGNASSQKARVASPMSGVVIKKGVELGETVTSGVSSFNAGTVLFTVADLKSLIVRVNLNEVDIAKVGVGQPVRITLDAYPQKVFTGRVRFVAPAAKLVEKIKVFEIEIALDELDELLPDRHERERRDPRRETPTPRSRSRSKALQKRDGETVAYRLKTPLAPKQLAAAKEGLSGRNKFTWLSDHWKEYFDVVPVKAGIATLERVEIASGLTAGGQVSLEDPTKKRIEKDDENN